MEKPMNSHYNDMLIFHDVGTGMSISAIGYEEYNPKYLFLDEPKSDTIDTSRMMTFTGSDTFVQRFSEYRSPS